MAATKKEKRQGQMETLKKVFHYMKHYIPILIFNEPATALTLITSAVLTVVLGIIGKKVTWLNNFTMAIVLILSMASAVLWSSLF